MRHLEGVLLTLWAVFTPFSLADEIVYVTDLEVFPLLAPCAASALSYAIQYQTYSECSEGETELQQCVCSSTATSRAVDLSISTAISASCGSDATQDLSSASLVFDKYCNPDTVLSFSTPTVNIVNAYITDLAEMEYMPPCARSGLSWAVMGASSYCPEAASLYAPCVCGKDYVVAHVSAELSSSVRYSCSNNADVTSAQNFYHEYCNMNNGTTSFAEPPGPPGDMTYYVTALDQFRSLRSCAQDGVSSAVQAQTGWACGEGPQALASCVCLKSGMKSSVSSSLTSNVKWRCDSTATNDVSSAMSVLEYYCSAAENEVAPSVTQSVAESYPVVHTRTSAGSDSPSETGTSGSSESGVGSSGDDNQDGNTPNQDGSNGGSSGDGNGGGIAKPALIAAIVLGAVVVIIAIAAIAWFIRRKKLKAKAAAEAAQQSHHPQPYMGPPELFGSEPNHSQVNIAKSVSPAVTEHPYGKPELGNVQINELPPQQGYRTELNGEGIPGGYAMPYGQPPQELASHNAYGHGGYGQSGYGQAYGHPPPTMNVRPGSAAPGSPSPISPPTPSYQQGPYPLPYQQHSNQNSWQSGPVEAYEMDAHRR